MSQDGHRQLGTPPSGQGSTTLDTIEAFNPRKWKASAAFCINADTILSSCYLDISHLTMEHPQGILSNPEAFIATIKQCVEEIDLVHLSVGCLLQIVGFSSVVQRWYNGISTCSDLTRTSGRLWPPIGQHRLWWRSKLGGIVMGRYAFLNKRLVHAAKNVRAYPTYTSFLFISSSNQLRSSYWTTILLQSLWQLRQAVSWVVFDKLSCKYFMASM